MSAGEHHPTVAATGLAITPPGNAESMIVDHIGLVVRSLEDGIKQWTGLFGYSVASQIVSNTRQKVRVVFLTKPGSLTVKLLEPADRDSPISKFANQGGGLHHLCFRCDDLKEDLASLKGRGAKILVPPEPGEAFNNHDIAFVLAGNGLNIEVIDTDEKAGLVPSRDVV